jgi:mono/diheme cytochrome c family protein
MHRNVALTVLLLGLNIGGSPTLAADPAQSAKNGQKIAEAWCASCHTVSARAPGCGRAGLSAIARNRAFDRNKLIQVLADPHPPMPNIHLSRQQLDDVIAYIHSLRRTK